MQAVNSQDMGEVNSSFNMETIMRSLGGKNGERTEVGGSILRSSLGVRGSKSVEVEERGIVQGSQYGHLKESMDRVEVNESLTRSLKIDCLGPSSIMSNVDSFNCEYVPRRGKSIKESSLIQEREVKAKILPELNCREFYEKKVKPLISFKIPIKQPSKIKESRSLRQQRRKKTTLIFTIILSTILLFLILSIQVQLVNTFTRQNIIHPYQKISLGIFPIQ